MKGWYIASRPDETAGDSTPWYASFWDFCAAYLTDRFGPGGACPQSSRFCSSAGTAVPAPAYVRSPKGGNQPTSASSWYVLVDIRSGPASKKRTDRRAGGPAPFFRTVGAWAELLRISIRSHPTDARAAVVHDPGRVGSIGAACWKAVNLSPAARGAFRNIGRARIADDILEGMRAAGYTVRENDPFEAQSTFTIPARERSPYVNRIRLMWQAMREPVMKCFRRLPDCPGH